MDRRLRLAAQMDRDGQMDLGNDLPVEIHRFGTKRELLASIRAVMNKADAE